jgi:hypothetical protein
MDNLTLDERQREQKIKKKKHRKASPEIGVNKGIKGHNGSKEMTQNYSFGWGR